MSGIFVLQVKHLIEMIPYLSRPVKNFNGIEKQPSDTFKISLKLKFAIYEDVIKKYAMKRKVCFLKEEV